MSWSALGGLALMSISGCGGTSADMAPVTGKVLLNGQPLVGAIVEFQPANKSPSIGVTDEEGQFRLKFSQNRWGAFIGEHVVKIDHDVDGRERPKSLLPIPARYNIKSELKRAVVAGSNSFDFDLKSDIRTATAKYR